MAIGANSWELDSNTRAEESAKKNRLKKIQRVVMFLGSFGFLMIMASSVMKIVCNSPRVHKAKKVKPKEVPDIEL